MSVFKSFFNSLRGRDWLETVEREELEKERLKVENQILLLSREIEKLEKEKKELFKQGIGKSEIEKMLIAEKIKDKDSDIRARIKDYNRLMKQRRVLSNLIRLKEWEQKLKEKGIWDKIKNIDPNILIEWLSKVTFEEESFEKNLDKINEILEERYAHVEIDETTKDIMELWEKVEKAELSPEIAEKRLTTKVVEKEKEEA